jgi:NarL family two-component system sensor histidine kinase LiaS
MKPSPFSLRRLRWKLAFSYALVTVGTLVALECIVAAIAIGVLLGTEALPASVARAFVSGAAPELGPAFAGERPDPVGIDAWLQRAGQQGLMLQAGGDSFDLSAETLATGGTRLLVLDNEGRLLGTLGQDGPPAAPVSFDAGTVPGLPSVLPRAQAGEEAERVYARPSLRHVTVAAPIRDARGQVRGILVFSRALNLNELPYRDFAGAFAISLAFFSIASGFIGTIFGFFTARGLTRRLSRMTTTASAWSEGDFARVIADRSADEIGQLSRQLDRMAGQLDELIRSRQQLSVVNERNRLARDLHDSVKQQVFAISMNLGAAQELWEQAPTAARGRLAAAFDLARQSQQELTTIIRTLRPVELEGKGVREALREYIGRWQDQSGIVATWTNEGDEALPVHVEEALFRVTQEALANVARHSGADEARVTLRTRPGPAAELTVCDDGHGFDARAQPLGVGLQSMRERVEAVHGSLVVTSGAGGTTLVARIPLDGEEERR